MKCISEFGNFFFNNLGIGVVNTISPKDENLIIKIFIFFLLNSLITFHSFSQGNLDTILYQKKRIEFTLSELDRNFYTHSNEQNLILLKDLETGKNLKWEIKLFDKNLEFINNIFFEIDRSYLVYQINSSFNSYKILFQKNYSNEKEFLIVEYNFRKNSISQKEISLPISLNLQKAIFFENDIVLLGTLKNGKNIISIYNLFSNQLINIFEFLNNNNSKILDIIKNNLSSFYVIEQTQLLKNFAYINKISYNLNGEKIQSYSINSKFNSILNTKIITKDDLDLSISLLKQKKSNLGNAIQFDIFSEGKNLISKKINLLEISSFSNLLIKKKNNIEKKIENKNYENISLGYDFVLDTFFIYDEKIFLSLESIKENFNNDGFSNYSYIPYYNTFSGTYDQKSNPNFGGYNHEVNIFLILDIEGNIFWNSVSEIDKLNTFYKRTYKKYLIEKNQVVEFYISKGKAEFNYNEIKENFISRNETISLNANENKTIVKTETNPEGTRNWYDNIFYTYGIQKLKETNPENKIKIVFFISKIEIH